MAFLAYASPLSSAKDYIWTTPNMPSNIAGVVGSPFARTEDVAYIHEAIAERSVLGGLGSGASRVLPVIVVRAADLPLTPAQAQANGWEIVSTGLVDGVVNVLAYSETVTNWPKAGGVDTWRMKSLTFGLPGGNWIDPSNDVSNLTAAEGESFTNCFNPWRGYMQPTNMTLNGLAWRPSLTNVLHRLASYKLEIFGGASLTNIAIGRATGNEYLVDYDHESHSMSLVPDNYTWVSTNGTDMGFSARHSAIKRASHYTDEDGNLQPYGGSPLSYRESYVRSTIGSLPGDQVPILSVLPIAFCLSTGGVWRVKSAKAIAEVFYRYERTGFTTGIGYETFDIRGGNVFVPVTTTATRENENGNLIVTVSTPLHSIAESEAQTAGVPTSDSGILPPEPQGEMTVEYYAENYREEELILRINGFYIILAVQPLTTIQELL